MGRHRLFSCWVGFGQDGYMCCTVLNLHWGCMSITDAEHGDRGDRGPSQGGRLGYREPSSLIRREDVRLSAGPPSTGDLAAPKGGRQDERF